jgi:hypothetical protein
VLKQQAMPVPAVIVPVLVYTMGQPDAKTTALTDEVVAFLFLGRVHWGHWVRVRTGKSCLCCYRALSFNHFDTASASQK